MADKRPKPKEIISKVRQVKMSIGQGIYRLDAIRHIGVVEHTYFSWRKQYGAMDVDQLMEQKRLRKNEQLNMTGTLIFGLMEIEGDAWIILAVRAKNGIKHRVPITSAMNSLLQVSGRDKGFVFSVTG